MKDLFLHTCCAVCAIYPSHFLLNEFPNINLKLWYYNPNIHPKKEYIKRRDTLSFFHLKHKTLHKKSFSLEISENYNYEDFFNLIKNNYKEPFRCKECYKLRLEEAAKEAKRQNFNFFSSTLLFSKRQKHQLIIEEAKEIAKKYNLIFYYCDWRKNWQDGHELSNEYQLYKQNYCACIFSELER